MQVRDIRDFIRRLNSCFETNPSLSTEAENATLNQIQGLISPDDDAEKKLTTPQLTSLHAIFLQRDDRIKDSEDDYTSTPNNPVNKIFVQLGIKLASDLKLPLVKILMRVDNVCCPCSGISFSDARSRFNGYFAKPITDAKGVTKPGFVAPELQGLVRMANTIYSIQGLLAINLSSDNGEYIAPFSMYQSVEDRNTGTKKAVPPDIFKNIQQKKEPLPLDHKIKDAQGVLKERTYTSADQLLREQILPKLKRYGEFKPVYIVNLIKHYLNSTTDEQWKANLANWTTDYLHNLSPEDIGCLHGQCFDKEGKLYFVDALNELSDARVSADLDEKIAIIAHWFFSRPRTNTVPNDLIAAYHDYWERTKDKPGDYFSHTHSSPYQRLAKNLSERGTPGWEDYYTSLIPTLTRNTDSLTEVPFILHPLSSYILSHDGTQLYYVRRFAEAYRPHKRDFCNHYTFPKTFFSDLEMSRLEKIDDPDIKAAVLQAKTIENGRCALQPETIQMLRRFANNIRQTYISDPDQTFKDMRALTDGFMQLSECERAKLNRYPVLREGYYSTVSNEFDYLFTGHGAGTCLYEFVKTVILPIVIDHDDLTLFHRSIDNETNKSDMRRLRMASHKMVYPEYNITRDEAVRRLKILLIASQCERFHGESETKFRRSLIEYIEPALQGETFYKDAPFKYAVIMEHLIKPAVMPTPSTRSWGLFSSSRDVFQSWLPSIKDHTLFHTYYSWKPSALLATLNQVKSTLENRYKIKLDQLLSRLEPLSQTEVSEHSGLLNEIKANIIWRQFVNQQEIESDQKESLLKLVKPRLSEMSVAPSSAPGK